MAEPGEYGIEPTPSGVTIRVYVAPRSSANKVAGAHNGALKIALTAPPVEGAANKALIEFLARLLGVPKGSIRLLSGETSRNKLVRIEGIDAQTAFMRLVGNE